LIIQEFPNIPFAASILEGFLIGFVSNAVVSGENKNKNHPIPVHMEKAVQKFVENELNGGRFSVISQKVYHSLPYKVTNPTAVVEQKGKFRVITDMRASKLNEKIDNSRYGPLILDRIPLLIAEIENFDKATPLLVCTEDVTAFYRQFWCRPVDRPLQITIHDKKFYIDNCECFGSCSAPFICSHFLDLFCWLMDKKYNLNIFHYLDNIFWVVRKEQGNSSQRLIQLNLEHFGVPTNTHDVQMSDNVKLLGFQIDTTQRTISIPRATLLVMTSLLDTLLSKENATIKNMQQITGKLLWACQSIKNGMGKASYLWASISRASSSNLKTIKIEKEVRSSLQWFRSTFLQWCGVSFYSISHEITVNNTKGAASDASHIGGAFMTSNHYAFWSWCPTCLTMTNQDMKILELTAILISHAVFNGLTSP
jgi:hypothetical protein